MPVASQQLVTQLPSAPARMADDQPKIAVVLLHQLTQMLLLSGHVDAGAGFRFSRLRLTVQREQRAGQRATKVNPGSAAPATDRLPTDCLTDLTRFAHLAYRQLTTDCLTTDCLTIGCLTTGRLNTGQMSRFRLPPRRAPGRQLVRQRRLPLARQFRPPEPLLQQFVRRRRNRPVQHHADDRIRILVDDQTHRLTEHRRRRYGRCDQ